MTHIIDRQTWTDVSLQRGWRGTPGRLEAGLDVGRSRDLSVLTVLARGRRWADRVTLIGDAGDGQTCVCRTNSGSSMRCARWRILTGVEIDMTGLGVGVVRVRGDAARFERLVRGVHFSSTEPVGRARAANQR